MFKNKKVMCVTAVLLLIFGYGRIADPAVSAGSATDFFNGHADNKGGSDGMSFAALQTGKESVLSPAKNPDNKSGKSSKNSSTGESTKAADEIVVFNDANLEKSIREEVGKPEGNIMSSLVAGIRWLRLADRKITDISALRFFKGLESLDLRHNQIKDASPLKNLTKLKILFISENQLTDLDALDSLKSLTRLNVEQNKIKDVSILGNLKNLEVLNISSNRITDISPLKDLSRLTVLYMNNNKITDLKVLNSLKNLVDLRLLNNGVEDVTPLGGLNNLSTLLLKGNRITDYSALAKNYGKIKNKDFLLVIPVKIIINGKSIKFDSQPTSIDDIVLAPVKPLFDAMGIKTEIGKDAVTITATKGKTKVILNIDSLEATIGQAKIQMEAVPEIVNGVFYVPVKSICQCFGVTSYSWDKTTKTVKITVK